MSSIDRQNKLLLAEDWKRIYQTFRNADFQSYDFENLRRTMIDYIRTNYPEDYNDYIESSEYLALIDLIAFLGQSIAFRVDLNARENFLELAERRDSILRTARMLSYNPKRNIAAQGLLKFATIQTTENILDSNGRNLSGQVITWNDSSNANWRDQFIRILNSALNLNQQYGNPIDKNTIYGIPTEQYRFENSDTNTPIYSFSKFVSSRSMTFEITSTSFNGRDYIYEEAPRVGNKLAFLYRDDGQGPNSPNTGFFLNFVQGILNVGSFTIQQPNTNESVDIETQGINNSDVWLYRLDQNGIEIEDWVQVPSFEGNNVIYNSLNKNIKNIYCVTTRAGDAITLAFSDGTFGNLPLGTFRVYYRISNGLSYVINPKDIRNVSISIPYISHKGQTETISITLTLTSSVVNASPAETNESIKVNAPAAYYTQNRMITGEDYNISPLTVNQQVAKIKSINRSSSGISRYFDLIDPTGKYSSTNLFASDGILYQEDYIFSSRFSYLDQSDITGIIYNQIYDILDQIELLQFYYANSIGSTDPRFKINLDAYWKKTTSAIVDTIGKFVNLDDTDLVISDNSSEDSLKYIKRGSLVKFLPPSGYYFDINNLNTLVKSTNQTLGLVDYIWAEIISIDSNNIVELSRTIPSSAKLVESVPKFSTILTPVVISTVTSLIYANKPFGLRYDTTSQSWKIVNEADLDISSNFSRKYEGDLTSQHKDASWLLLFTTDNEYYTVKIRQLRYIFESNNEIKFYFDKANKIYDSKSTKLIKDAIIVLNFNTKPNNSTSSFVQDFKWDIVSEFTGIDGYFDDKKIIITFADNNDNGVVDDPELFLKIVDPINSSIENQYIIQEKYAISEGQEDYRYTNNFDSNMNQKVIILQSESKISSLSTYNDSQYFYFIDTNTVKKLNSSKTGLVASLDYKVYLGRANLKFQYTHNADYEARLDPGVSNIIDIFVLTKSYDVAFRQWVSGISADKPLPPSSNELYNTLAPNLNLIKSISDEIIFHPVSYKILFGSQADNEVQASFKVIKSSYKVISDNDIKARVISAINQFFELENWDFGDTFYFTELATYVMNKLSPDISNFVIVPRQSGLNFGSLFEIKSASDQLFINGATVDDIEIISSITPTNIKAFSNTTIDSTVLTQQYVTSSVYGSI